MRDVREAFSNAVLSIVSIHRKDSVLSAHRIGLEET
jgi:hypothetical protein